MDYEKKYNEALAKAREIKSKILSSHLSTESCKAVSEYIDEIIPELRESESEKNWKAVLEYIKDDSLRSWLEKQKEQKPDIELLQQSWYMEGYKDREYNCEPKWNVKTCEDGPCYEENPKYGQMLAEQKPIPDWMPKFLDELRSKKNYFDWDEHRDIEGHILAIINWIEPDYFKRKEEQKPAEKQDYSGLNDLERAIHRGFLCAGVENVPVGIIKETAKDCLAHMPVEWSEEDEKVREALYKHFRLYPGDGRFRDTKLSNCQITDFLKSIHPSWKPSKEQMEALGTAERWYSDNMGCNSALVSLCEQLRKLRYGCSG